MELGPNEELPTTRKWSKTAVQDETAMNVKCHYCIVERCSCDAVQPPSIDEPCTRCRQMKRICQAEEDHWERKKKGKCSNCKMRGYRCDGRPMCGKYIEKEHSRCTYTSADRTRDESTLTAPVEYTGEKTFAPNIDFFNRRGSKSCTSCEGSCDRKAGGPPCNQCMRH